MKFKKPKSKDLTTVVKGLLAFEGGKRVGRGIVGQINPTSDANAQMIKGGVAAVALLAAAAYQGKNKDLVLPAFVGLASEQIGNIIDAQAAEMIEKKANPGMAEQFVYDAFGLASPAQQDYPMLAQPTIRQIDWNTVYAGEEKAVKEINDFSGA